MEREEFAVIMSKTAVFTSALPCIHEALAALQTDPLHHPCTQTLAKGKAEQKPPTAHPKGKERAAAPTREE